MARQTTTRRKKGATDEALPAESSAGPGSAQDSAELRRRIERRAYEIWEREGRPSGQEAEHWRRAEAELAAEAGGPEPAGGEQDVGGTATPPSTTKRLRAAAKRDAGSGEAASRTTTRRRNSSG